MTLTTRETAGEVMFVRTGALTHQMFRRLSNMNGVYF
jgi:hypothetical protein